MRLKRLTIENIASIEHAVIDFDAAPLIDEHLFLITGETGSGKSTIIDCICLALYGNTPRLNAARKDDYDTSGSNEESLKTDDVRQLLRRGTVSADVCLTFDDDEGTPYVATWHVHRSHNKIEGAIQKPVRVIETDETAAKHDYFSKANELKAFNKRVIGLDMNEFFRTVVLAQGKFAEFLNSDENDKSDLLERLTGTQIYTQVGSKIFEVCREKEMERDNLKTQLQGIVLLTDEEKEHINQEIAAHSQKYDEAAKQGENAKQMLQWLDDKAQIEKELAEKTRELAEKRSLTEQATYLEKLRLADDWDATIEPRRELRESQRAERQIQSLQQEKPAMQEEFDRLCAALRAAAARLERQQSQLDETNRLLNQEAANKEMYKGIQGIKRLLKQRLSEQDNITQYTRTLHQDEKRQPNVEATAHTTLKAQEEQKKQVKLLEAELEKMDTAGINRLKDALNNAKQGLMQLIACNDAIGQAAERENSLKQELTDERQTLEKLQGTLADKRTIKEQALAAVERESDWNNLLLQAHKSLHKGDTCPVCGHVIEELLQPTAETTLQELRNKLREAENDLNNTEANITASGKAITRIQTQVDKASAEVIKRTQARDLQWQQTSQLLARCGKAVDAPTDNVQAATLIGAIDHETEELNTRLQAATALNNRIINERDKLAMLTQSHNKAQLDLNNVIESIKHQHEVIEHSVLRVNALTNDLDGMFAMPDWQDRLASQADFIQELDRKATEYQDLEKAAQRLTRETSIARTVIPAMEDNKRNIQGLEDNEKATETIPSNLDELWRQLENRNINWNNQLGNERDKAQSSRQAVDDYINKHPGMDIERLTSLDAHPAGEIEAFKREHKQLTDLITHMQGEMSALKLRQQELNGKKPDFHEQDRERLEEIIHTRQQQQQELNALIADLNVRLKTDEANQKAVGETKAALDTADAVFKQWYDLKEVLGDSKGNKFRRIAQSYILNELLHTANGYLRQFNDRYELVARPGKLVILVRDLLQGDLTSVNTLSGGESFMVALALALALSSTTGKMFSVDTLFIDEGFGSLSDNYLGSVMNTLNRLYEMGGRRVGIISHVKMLKEHVTTQIVVEHDEGNNTVSRVKTISMQDGAASL